MPTTHKALFLTGINGDWEVRDRPTPAVTADTLLVRVHALALNTIDWRIREVQYIINKWPAIIGSDVAGTVEAVGENVSGYSVGDRVFGFARGVGLNNPDEGAFQEYMLLSPSVCSLIPPRRKSSGEEFSFEQAATVPMGLATAAGALRDLGITLPGMLLNQSPPDSKQAYSQDSSAIPAPVPATQAKPNAVLIWGAGGVMGAAAIQLARAAGVTVLATASPAQHSRLRQLGADHVFDYRSPSVVDELRAAATQAGVVINKTLDTASIDTAYVAQVLSALGGGDVARLTQPEIVVPDGVKVFFSGARSALIGSDENPAFGAWLFQKYIYGALERGEFVPSPIQLLQPGGIDGIEAGLAKLKAGVSGVKLVAQIK